MTYYEVTMQHSADSLLALSRMQYDLFCTRNRIVRTILSAVLVIIGVLNYSAWWGILLLAYGCYLTTSTYVSPDRTAHKLTHLPCGAQVDSMETLASEDPHDCNTVEHSDLEIGRASCRERV